MDSVKKMKKKKEIQASETYGRKKSSSCDLFTYLPNTILLIEAFRYAQTRQKWNIFKGFAERVLV